MWSFGLLQEAKCGAAKHLCLRRWCEKQRSKLVLLTKIKVKKVIYQICLQIQEQNYEFKNGLPKPRVTWQSPTSLLIGSMKQIIFFSFRIKFGHSPLEVATHQTCPRGEQLPLGGLKWNNVQTINRMPNWGQITLS